MLAFDGPADVEGDHQAQFVLAVKLAVIIQQRHLGQQGGSWRNNRPVGGHRGAADQRHSAGPFHRRERLRFKEHERRVLLQQLAHFRFAVLLTPLADRLHRHIFFLHFPAVDQHFADAAIGPAVFPGIAKEVERRTIAKVDIAAALHVHDEVIHQRIAVRQHIVIAQRAGIDAGAGRQLTALWRHTVNGVLEFALTGVARLHHRRVVAGKLDVAIVVDALHLPGVDAKLAQRTGVAAGAQPLLQRVIDVALAIIEAWRGVTNLINLLGEVAGVDRRPDGIRLVYQ